MKHHRIAAVYGNLYFKIEIYILELEFLQRVLEVLRQGRESVAGGSDFARDEALNRRKKIFTKDIFLMYNHNYLHIRLWLEFSSHFSL